MCVTHNDTIDRFFKSAKNYKSEIFDVNIPGAYGIFIPNMKFLCLTLWLGGVCTDDDDDAKDDDANNDARQ